MRGEGERRREREEGRITEKTEKCGKKTWVTKEEEYDSGTG